MAAPFTSECWPTREFLCADEPHPSHQSSSLPLHSNEQQRVDHGLLQPGFETPNLSSGVGNYPSPSPAEQGALSVLKGYPDHLLAIWFDLARQDRFGISCSLFVCITNSKQCRRMLTRRVPYPYCVPLHH